MLGWSISAGLTTCHDRLALKYDAFIACSEEDMAWADGLAHGLEQLRVGKHRARGLFAKRGGRRRLYPIFRDGVDGRGDYSLPEETIAALDDSRALIVICSPAAAKSHHVNEEIRLFKSQHPRRPVIPLIIGGTPGDPDSECFPSLLKFELDADGCIKGGPIDVQAADVRQGAGRYDRALARLASELLGIPAKDSGRAFGQKARARSNSLENMLNFAFVGGLGFLLAWQTLKANQTVLDETLSVLNAGLNGAASQAIAQGVPRSVIVGLLEDGEKLLGSIASLGRATPDIECRKAAIRAELAHTYRSLGEQKKAHALAADARLLLKASHAEPRGDADLRCRRRNVEEALGALSATQGATR